MHLEAKRRLLGGYNRARQRKVMSTVPGPSNRGFDKKPYDTDIDIQDAIEHLEQEEAPFVYQ